LSYTNFPLLPAPLSVLAFLGAGAGTAALLAAAAVLALAGRGGLARRAAAGGLLLPVCYGAVLAALGAATRERIVPRGAEKFFCEIDCHVGNGVAGIATAEEGSVRRVTVTVRSRFDERTISPRRGNGPLTPNPRIAALVDARGRRFPAGSAGVAALGAPLRPGESYVTELVFVVPADAADLRLSLVEAEPLVRILPGHERAPLAGETLLGLR